MLRRLIGIAGLALLVAPLAACATNAAGTPAAGDASTTAEPTFAGLPTPVQQGAAADPYLGTWGGPAAPRVEFHADGSVSVNDGCNPYEGTYTVSDGDVTIVPGIQTRRACKDTVAWLGLIDGATVDGDVLTFIGNDGAVVGTLNRTA